MGKFPNNLGYFSIRRSLLDGECTLSDGGEAARRIEHLRRAIEGREQFRKLAAGDSDFDPIREESAFKELVG